MLEAPGLVAGFHDVALMCHSNSSSSGISVGVSFPSPLKGEGEGEGEGECPGFGTKSTGDRHSFKHFEGHTD